MKYEENLLELKLKKIVFEGSDFFQTVFLSGVKNLCSDRKSKLISFLDFQPDQFGLL